MGEYSGMNTVAALREARRRKILENSANRLKLIEGINLSVKEETVEYCQESTLKPEIENSEVSAKKTENLKPKLNPQLNETINGSKELKEMSDSIPLGGKKVEEDGEEEAEVLVFEQNKVKTFLDTFLQKKLHYILLAIIVNVMLLYNVGHLFYENIFCPFCTVKLLEVLSRKEARQLHLLCYILIAAVPEKLQKLTEVAFLAISILMSDLSLYLFTFIVGNKLATTL